MEGGLMEKKLGERCGDGPNALYTHMYETIEELKKSHRKWERFFYSGKSIIQAWLTVSSHTQEKKITFLPLFRFLLIPFYWHDNADLAINFLKSSGKT